MYYVESALRKRGGVARTWELAAEGIDPFFIELAADKRRITRLRKGWYGVNDLDPRRETGHPFGRHPGVSQRS